MRVLLVMRQKTQAGVQGSLTHLLSFLLVVARLRLLAKLTSVDSCSADAGEVINL